MAAPVFYRDGPVNRETADGQAVAIRWPTQCTQQPIDCSELACQRESIIMAELHP